MCDTGSSYCRFRFSFVSSANCFSFIIEKIAAPTFFGFASLSIRDFEISSLENLGFENQLDRLLPLHKQGRRRTSFDGRSRCLVKIDPHRLFRPSIAPE